MRVTILDYLPHAYKCKKCTVMVVSMRAKQFRVLSAREYRAKICMHYFVCVLSSFAIILTRKRESVALLLLS